MIIYSDVIFNKKLSSIRKYNLKKIATSIKNLIYWLIYYSNHSLITVSINFKDI